MGRILAIDYGQKRVGLAVTDELKLIASGLETVHVKDIWTYLQNYFENENVEIVVIGVPKDMRGAPSDSTRVIEPFVAAFKKKFPAIQIHRFDERFTSKIAMDTMIAGGLSKKREETKH